MTTVRHLVCTRPGTAWEEAVRPWFALLGREAWAAERPVAALVPDGVAASVLKRRLAEAGLPLVGIDIFTPGRLRHRLARATGEDKPVAVREELTLFLRLAVQTLPDNAFARAVLAEPTAFLRDFDALDAAGWEGEVFRFAPANKLARALREQLERAGMQTAAAAARLPVREEPVFSHLLVTGFGPAQSEHFFLLRSALAAAEEATVVFSQPVSDSPLDFAFTETWETLLGPAAPAPGEAEEVAEPDAEPAFLLAPDPCAEAKLVVDQVTRWLAQADNAVIGVVFPHRGLSLPREVALGLRDQRAARAVAEPLGVAVVVRAHLVGRAAEALPPGALVRFWPQTRGRRRREAEGVERVLRGPRPVEHDLQVVGVVAPEPLVVVLEVQDRWPEGVGAELVEAAPVLEQRLQLLEQLQALRRRLPPERAHGAHAAGHVAAVVSGWGSLHRSRSLPCSPTGAGRL